MTQEKKELLLKYLCMALPYKVIIKSVGENKIIGLWDLRDIDNLPFPYLRPMSSMTKEEWDEYDNMCDESALEDCCQLINWLLEHHLDFMGLIPKDLAIEVTNKNNPYKD